MIDTKRLATDAAYWDSVAPDHKPSNREQAMKPKLGKAWCGCDRWYGPMNYGKCPVCGGKPTGRLKKETSAR